MVVEALTADQRETLQSFLDSDPPTWISRNFYIQDPRDPTTGDLLPPGPIRLAPIQERIIRAALIKIGGQFRYSTVVFSTIKKSGKTRVGAAVGAWFAATQGSYNEIYCMANDGKQSSDRILSAVRQSVELNPQTDWRITKTKITLPNSTFIEAIPCDPTGQAGANPGLTLWSELWGYRHEHKERLWSEMTIPPTRWGSAVRWVESYAGYKGESSVLWDLYELGTQHGYRHPAFPDIPVYINDQANMFCYWDEGDEARRMPWQTDDYYAQEAVLLTDAEFDRIHRNRWIEPINKALPVEWWDKCHIDRFGFTMPPLNRSTPVVVGVDAAVSGACAACSMVSRHPARNSQKTNTLVRAVRIWEPPSGGTIDLNETIGNTIREWVGKYNVVEVAYDEYQLHQMMTDFRRAGMPTRFYRFSQMAPRYIADKQLYDMIILERIWHDGHSGLRAHVDNAMAKTSGEKFRFVTEDSGQSQTYGKFRSHKPIDALIATSMANAECMRLIL